MRKRAPILSLIHSISFLFFFVGHGPNLAAENKLVTYEMPYEILESDRFELRARPVGGEWQEIFVHQTPVNLLNLTYAGFSTFSFGGKIEVEITALKEDIETLQIKPEARAINPEIDGRKARFIFEHSDRFAPKLVAVLNNNRDAVMMIGAHKLEENAPSPSDPNVSVIEPGQTIRPLNEGQDTYYFAPGLHAGNHLGEWLELDFGHSKVFSRLELDQVELAHSFKLYGRNSLESDYRLIFHQPAHRKDALLTADFRPVQYRYVKFQFQDNELEHRRYDVHVKRLSIYKRNDQTDLAQGAMRVASSPDLQHLVDGNFDTTYDRKRSSGRFHFYAEGQNVYIPGEAVLYGGFKAHGLKDLKLFGRGILDARKMPYSFNTDRTSRVIPYLKIGDVEKMQISGLSIFDPPGWTMHLAIKDGEVDSLNVLGSKFNSDGISAPDGDGIKISNCFVRSSDDILVLNNSRNIDVRNCVFWGDKAHVVFLGLGPEGTITENLYLESIDVLGAFDYDKRYQGVIGIKASNDNTVRNLTFTDWRIEDFKKPQYARIVSIHMDLRTPWQRSQGTAVENIHINYTFNGRMPLPSIIHGASDERTVRGVTFENCFHNGVKVTDPESGNIEIGPYTKDITFK